MNTLPSADALRDRLAPLKASLLSHRVYDRVRDLPSLRRFMEHHVFAVWDFMSLLKELQRRLCCTSVPWLPPNDAEAARMVNEIVLAEESDEDGRGGHLSHFGLYHRAMKECGADTSRIDAFLRQLRAGRRVASALEGVEAPAGVRAFVTGTFAVIDGGKTWEIASAFTFGREDLLPDVFSRLVDELAAVPGNGLDTLRYYLHRHIGLDGDEHGPMAVKLVSSLCGTDAARWREAEDAATASLKARAALWDGIVV